MDDLEQTVDALARPLLASGETPGLVVGVLDADGSKRFFSYGGSELGGRPLSPDSLFPLGSVSKGYAAALLGLLVHEGRLAWDETLQTLLPGMPLSADAKRISLLQLATHSAGLPRQPFELRLLLELSRFTLTGDNFYARYDRSYIERYLADFSAPQSPRPAYSNIGYALIGMVIEARTGQRFEQLLADKVLQPLGLRNTGFAPQQLPAAAHRAQGHVGDQPKFMRRGRPVQDWQFPPALQASAALYANARDLLNFAQAHLPPRCGQAASGLRPLLADNLRVRVAQAQDAPGIAWVTDQHQGLTLANQVGMAVGHTSYVGIDAEHGRAVVVLQTSFNWNFKIGHVLLQRLAQSRPAGDDCMARLDKRGAPG